MAHHQVVIVGGGAAGVSVASRLLRRGLDVAVIDPAEKHYYQPLWTLVGGGAADVAKSERDQASVIPRSSTWYRLAATGFEPDHDRVLLETDFAVGYDVLVVCPGIQLDWDRIPGVPGTLGQGGVSSNYTRDLAPKTWEYIRTLRSGNAVFTMPSGPIKCAGAPQKIAYLACDFWRSQGVLDAINVHLVLPTPGMFGVPVFAKELEKVAADYGINVHFSSELESVDSPTQRAHFAPVGNGGSAFTLPYDIMHVVPHQSAPDWVKASPLANDTPAGYVDVDKHTHQHVRYPNVFALGDAGSTPNSKTGAAVRKQAPVVAANVRDFLHGRTLRARYDGYASCPLTTSQSQMLLAEFDYRMEPTPTIPLINTFKPRRDMWYLKKYGLPFLYWHLMLKGRA